jgi:hypothetical protein
MRRHPQLLKSWIAVVTFSLALSSVGLAYGLTHAAAANVMGCVAVHASVPNWSYSQTSVQGTFGLAVYYHRSVTAVYHARSDQTVACLSDGVVREQVERTGAVAIYAGLAASGAPLETHTFHAVQIMMGPIETAFYPQTPTGWFAPNWSATTLSQHYVWEVGGVYRLDWWQAHGSPRISWRLGTANGECRVGSASCAALGYPPLPVQ